MSQGTRGIPLADAGKLLAVHSSDNMRDRVLAFIVEYQDQHTGNTPTIDLIARALGTVEAAVRQMIHRLEGARKLHIISRKPFRALVMERDAVLPHEQGSVTGLAPDPKRYDRMLEADGTRHGLCRWIGQFNDAFGHGPTLREMMTYLKITNGAWVNRQVEIMAERGLLQYGPGKNTELTDQGRIFYRAPKPTLTIVPITEEEKDMNKLYDPAQKGVVHDDHSAAVATGDAPKVHEDYGGGYAETVRKRMEAPVIANYVDRVGHFLYEWEQKGIATGPQHREISKAVGVTTSSTMAATLLTMERDGLIEPRLKAGKRNVFLTDAGRARFAPVAKPEAAPQVEPGPEKQEGVASDAPPQTYGDIQPAVLNWVANRQRERDRATAEASRAPEAKLPEPPTPQEWFAKDAEPTPTAPPTSLDGVATSELIMELIERGYVVKK